MVADHDTECAGQATDAGHMVVDVTVVTVPQEGDSTTLVDVFDLVPLDWAKAPYALLKTVELN